MKGHIIPFRQPYSLFDLLFRPKREFKAEWQLDYHGFMTREEFDIRLEDINKHIRHLPLMTEVVRKILSYVVLICAIGLTIYMLRLGPGAGTLFGLFFFFVSYFGGLYLVDHLAEQRAAQFTSALKALFVTYNNVDNPTANWRVLWVAEVSGWKTKTTSNGYGGSTSRTKPKFAEYVMIVLDISDALSDLTSNTVNVKFTSTIPNNMNGAISMANNINEKHHQQFVGNSINMMV